MFVLVNHNNEVYTTKNEFKPLTKRTRLMTFESKDEVRNFVSINNLTTNYKISTMARIKKQLK